MDSHTLVWPLELGITDSHTLVWPLELGIWTPTLWCGPLSWGYGLPRFGVALSWAQKEQGALYGL